MAAATRILKRDILKMLFKSESCLSESKLGRTKKVIKELDGEMLES